MRSVFHFIEPLKRSRMKLNSLAICLTYKYSRLFSSKEGSNSLENLSSIICLLLLFIMSSLSLSISRSKLSQLCKVYHKNQQRYTSCLAVKEKRKPTKVTLVCVCVCFEQLKICFKWLI